MNRFTKHNASGFPDALIREAEGLAALRDALHRANVTGLKVPEVHRVDQQVLVMTAITATAPSRKDWQVLAEGLAAIHGIDQSFYGYERANYLGLSPQPNQPAEDWGEFFLNHRLTYQALKIRHEGRRRKVLQLLDAVGDQLVVWLNANCRSPSLLHGDLWRGNILFDRTGPWFIDPAVYNGDREADMAMTEMFGGFDPAFYQAYEAVMPRSEADGYKREVYNLYHYLNHYNLFGEGYWLGCERGLETLRRSG
ncbi:MAG: fructosamine kinase family protein [Marinobacter sp.]|nr:fructosamine kinase family protein [Marinobacter sp.]